LIALASRLSAALFLPNAEQDAYSYAEIIARISTNLGHFRLTDLYSFWLPLFQFTAAIPNVWIDNPLLIGKILSALCGATSCLVVFAITEKLTRSRVFAGMTFALVVCNPLHILYSAASMTDVPHACLVLASLWFLLHERWMGAAMFAAIAESIRIESWSLIILLPLLQFFRQRRVSAAILAILLLPPLGWLLICQLATRDPLSFFAEHARYQASYVDFHPTRRDFVFTDIKRDFIYFFLGANRIVFFATLAASGLLMWQAIRRRHRLYWPAVFNAAYALTFFGFLTFAYLTKRQPVILPRYGLIFFVLGLPLLAWLLQLFIRYWKPAWMARCAATAAIAFCFWQSKHQLPVIFKVLDDFRAHRQVANIIATAFHESPDSTARCFSDDVAVRVLSRLPPERFVRSTLAPAWAWESVGGFEMYLREQRAAYLVFMHIEDSLPPKLLPELSRNTDTGIFQFITVAFSPFGPDVSLYRVRNAN
jgi:hypothetical protein